MTTITVNAEKKQHEISPLLYGIFFEDINYAGDGGLYAELVANRSFSYYGHKHIGEAEDRAEYHRMCWELVGEAEFTVATERPLNEVHTHYARVSGKQGTGIRNCGFCNEGFAVKEGAEYRFTCYVRAKKLCELNVCITEAQPERKSTIGERSITIKSNLECHKEVVCGALETDWQKIELTIQAQATCKHAYLELLLAEEGEVELAYVSLFPADTYKGRRNGMRRDLAELLKKMQPKFMRFPGGCIVEGRSFENMYRWKETLGEVTERRTNWNRWQLEEYQPEGRHSADYYQSYGLGYYEYFLLCEDLGATPLPVMNVGMTCQWHEALLVDLTELTPYIQDILDLIEFANGTPDTVWGAKRAAMGHPEPFGLEYIGIGNEQWGKEYFERYEVFQKEITERYPEIKLITCAGWTAEGKDFDTAQEWMKAHRKEAYAVDEHFYKSPEWFLANLHRYDNYDRTLPKVFAGEYAAHTAGEVAERRNNWYAALCEAAFLIGVERNSDHVVMACYAPLFARAGHQQWQPDLIWFDNDRAYGTPSYYVQQLFATHQGDWQVESICDDAELQVCVAVKEAMATDGQSAGNECEATASCEKRLIIKIVNLSAEEKEICIRTEQMPSDNVGAEIYELYADLDAENSFEQPDRVKPIKRVLERFDGRYTIQGNSVTIFEIG